MVWKRIADKALINGLVDANGQKRKHTFYLSPSFREGTPNLWLSVVGFADFFSLLRFFSPNHLKILIYLTLFFYHFVFSAFPFASSLSFDHFHRSFLFFLDDIVTRLLTISVALWTLYSTHLEWSSYSVTFSPLFCLKSSPSFHLFL